MEIDQIEINQNGLGLRYPNPIGKVFGLLAVVGIYSTKRPGKHYLCRCDCGRTTVATARVLYNGKRTSCGCQMKVRAIKLGKAKRVCPEGRYEKYRADTLSDAYIKGLIAKGTSLKNKDIPTELVELKRTQIQLYRDLKGR